MRVSPLPRPRMSRSRLRAHQNSSFPRHARTMPSRNGPPRRFLKSRSSDRRSRATTRSLAHIVRAPRGRGERRSLHSSAFGTRRTPRLRDRTRRWKLAPGMMIHRPRRPPQHVGPARRLFERPRIRNAKQTRHPPARETSGRRRAFLSPNRRGSASRARPPPFLCQTVARTRRVLMKWKL